MSTSDYTNTPPNPEDTPATILSPVVQALTKHNLTLDRLAGKIHDLVDCTRPVGTDKDGQAIDTPDNPSQIKAVDMALKLQQAYPAERLKLDTDTDITINLVQYGADKAKTPETITPCNDMEKSTSPTGERPDKTDSALFVDTHG